MPDKNQTWHYYKHLLWPTIKHQPKICQFLKLANSYSSLIQFFNHANQANKSKRLSVSFCWHCRTKIWNKLKLRICTNYHDNVSDKYSMNEMISLYWVEWLKVMFHTMQYANSFRYHSAYIVEPRSEISWNCVYEQIIMTILVTNTVWTRWLACTEWSDRKWCSIRCNMQQIIVLTDQFAYIGIYWSVCVHQYILISRDTSIHIAHTQIPVPNI